MSTQPHPGASQYFYKFALAYYVQGRAAQICRNTLITGNLFHHAVEMLLKGQLSKTLPLSNLKSPQLFGHDLPKLWTAFKGLFSAENLSAFDAMIVELEKFDDIRYPDEILKQGAAISLGWGTGRAATSSGSEPEYQMGIGDVDAFFGRLFPLCGIEPKGYLSYLSPQGRQILAEANEVCQNWLP